MDEGGRESREGGLRRLDLRSRSDDGDFVCFPFGDGEEEVSKDLGWVMGEESKVDRGKEAKRGGGEEKLSSRS